MWSSGSPSWPSRCGRSSRGARSGQRGKFLRAALRRIAGTKISGIVYDASTKRRVGRDFTIFDLQIEDRADSLDGPSLGPVIVTVILSKFIFDQLMAGQLSELDWGILRRNLTTPLSKRLYVGYSRDTCKSGNGPGQSTC